MKEIMSIKEVANYLCVPYSQIFCLVHGEALKAFRVGKHWRIKSADLEKWIEENIKSHRHTIGTK